MDYQQPFVARPNSHLVLAILTTLCCCSPFGLIAIYKASKVHDYVVIKQYESAIMAANSAKRWCIISFCISFLINIILLITVTFSIGTSVISIFPLLKVFLEFISKLNDLIGSLDVFWGTT